MRRFHTLGYIVIYDLLGVLQKPNTNQYKWSSRPWFMNKTFTRIWLRAIFVGLLEFTSTNIEMDTDVLM